MTGVALELKGEEFHVITLPVELHCTQTKGNRNIHQKKDVAGPSVLKIAVFKLRSNTSNSDFQICQTIIKSAPCNALQVSPQAKAEKNVFYNFKCYKEHVQANPHIPYMDLHVILQKYKSIKIKSLPFVSRNIWKKHDSF